ncbi:MAG: hypothetical protein MZV64_49155 [Ignavibacteriales bacterium]|nr:hypothetical protein [Ignavibacteriales bacterium]
MLDWLRHRIFPFEAAHSSSSMYASARIGLAEVIRSGHDYDHGHGQRAPRRRSGPRCHRIRHPRFPREGA